MPQAPDFTTLFDDDINLRGLFDILSPENNLVLADDMMVGTVALAYAFAWGNLKKISLAEVLKDDTMI